MQAPDIQKFARIIPGALSREAFDDIVKRENTVLLIADGGGSVTRRWAFGDLAHRGECQPIVRDLVADHIPSNISIFPLTACKAACETGPIILGLIWEGKTTFQRNSCQGQLESFTTYSPLFNTMQPQASELRLQPSLICSPKIRAMQAGVCKDV